MTIATYVINLDGSTERLDAISRRLSAFGIAFERVPAFDGRKVDLATVADYDAVRTRHYMGRSLVGGELGCYRSHLAVATRFLASEAHHALVFEDDALPLTDPVALLAQALPDLDAIDPDWMLVNIGNKKLRIATFLSHYSSGGGDCALAAAHYFPMTTSAIVWSRKGAQRFVEGHSVIFAPVDNYFRYWLTREGHGYSFWPAPVTTTEAASLIVSSGGTHRKEHGRKWYYGIVKQKRLLEEKLIAVCRQRQFRRSLSAGRSLRPTRAEPDRGGADIAIPDGLPRSPPAPRP